VATWNKNATWIHRVRDRDAYDRELDRRDIALQTDQIAPAAKTAGANATHSSSTISI